MCAESRLARRSGAADADRAAGDLSTISNRVLTQPSNDLEADRVPLRIGYREVPPRVDYMLTPLGRRLADAIVSLHMAEMAGIVANRETLP
jgi:DNA-binding HxlR family transcriptional regulator